MCIYLSRQGPDVHHPRQGPDVHHHRAYDNVSEQRLNISIRRGCACYLLLTKSTERLQEDTIRIH